MPPSLASGFRKLKADGTGQCLYFVWCCSQTPRSFACFGYQPGMVADTCQEQRRGCLFILLLFFIARKSQCLQWSHLARSLGLAAHYDFQLTTTNSTTTPLRLRCKYLCEGACFGRGDLLKVQPGHSIGPRKLRNAGALKCVIHFTCCLYIMMGFYSNGISSKTMASQKPGNQCKGLSPFIAGCDGAASKYPGRTIQVCDCHSGLHAVQS